MKIEIKTIPHEKQRYETVGDWQILPDGSLKIAVSEMGNDDYAFLVAIHEAIEVWLCKKRGITTEQVDTFDIVFEQNRADDDDSEPGDHPDAPYRKEHFFATSIERLLAAELGVDWETYSSVAEYDKTVTEL
jgi:hypothetical protein